MLPVAGELWGLPIYSYGLAVSAALLVCLALAWRIRERAGLATGDLLNLCLLGVAALLFVPKLWVMILAGDFSPGAWRLLLSPWRQEGFALGPVAVVAALGWAAYGRWKRIPLLPAIDAFLPVLLLGLAIQRLGCFLAGCCYGRPTGLPWGVRFPADSPAGRAFPGEAVHPTQLYYLLVFLLLAGLLWLGRGLLRRTGATTAAGLVGTGVAFVAVTALRGDLGPGGRSPAAMASPLVALGLAVAGLMLGAGIAWQRYRNDRKSESTAGRNHPPPAMNPGRRNP